MEKNFKRTTVTAALPYANGGVHIGHLAGVYVPADIYVRYLRLKKKDVIFIGGSDEHGVPVTIRARKEGITVQEVVDRYHKLIKDSFAEFGISFDIYSRTTSKIHHKFASDFFRKLYDDGKLEEITEERFASYLDTKDLPDPDLMIRTSGEQRLSNWMLWQLAYAEFYFTEVLWPDFDKEELIKAVEYYNTRERRFGGV